MDLTHERLSPMLYRITETLKDNPEELHAFERWAVAVLQGLVAAAGEGDAPLKRVLMDLGHELADLQRDLSAIHVTGRSQVRRMCRREWLTTLIELVDQSRGYGDSGVWRVAA